MATLTQEQTKSLLDQIAEAQRRLDEIKRIQSGGTTAPNPALEFGAAGRGEMFEGLPEADAQALSGQIQTATEAGVPMSELGTRDPETGKSFLEDPSRFKPKTLSSGQSARYVSSFGLEGILDPSSFAGLTAEEANRRGIEEVAKRRGQVSAQTSFAFNPETLNRTQRAIDKLGFALDDVDNDPFEPQEFKEENRANTLEITSREIGQLFNSPDDLLAAYQTNPQFRSSIDSFVERGGSIDSISKNISAPVAGDDPQDPASFLGNLRNPQADPIAEQQAIDELMPESEIAQAEIARISQIPEDLKTLYFGDAKTIGLLEMRQKQSEEEIRIIEEKQKDAKRTARDRASLQMDRNRAEVKQQKAKIEENRLRAKNYMTGALAKLGALKTTGAAPVALQTLETKYQGQVSQLETAYQFAEREIEIGLEEDIDSIENNSAEAILKIQEDLTLDTEKVTKEILKEQQKAEKETYRISEQYARRLRERTAKYTADLKKEAEKYAKEYAKVASDNLKTRQLSESVGEGGYVKGKGVLLPDGTFTDLRLTPSQQQEIESANIFGDSTMRYFLTLPNKFRDEFARESISLGRNVHSVDEIQVAFEEWTRAQDEDEGDDDDVF
jgi:hypothetical protein